MQRHVISADPGKNDFAYCDVVGTEIKSLGMLTETINDLKSGVFPYRLRVFYRQFKKIVESSASKYGPVTDIVIERYLARPNKGGGAVGESINVMIGVMALYCYKNGIHIELVTSSLWKNRFKRKLGGDTQAERYGFPWVQKNELKGNPYPIKDHEFDASGIALAYIETAPELGSGTTRKQNNDHFNSFKKQLRVIWNARAKKTGYDEDKDLQREAKAKQRSKEKAKQDSKPRRKNPGGKAPKPTKTNKAGKTRRKSRSTKKK